MLTGLLLHKKKHFKIFCVMLSSTPLLLTAGILILL